MVAALVTMTSQQVSNQYSISVQTTRDYLPSSKVSLVAESYGRRSSTMRRIQVRSALLSSQAELC